MLSAPHAQINLDPPIRQGQTRYPYLVMQFAREEVMEAELNLDECVHCFESNLNDSLLARPDHREGVREKYPDLKEKYEDQAYTVVSSIFKAVTNKKAVVPSQNFTSASGNNAIKCNRSLHSVVSS